MKDKENDIFTFDELEVHWIMMQDSAKTGAYKKAIDNNKEFFKDKIVMDVGSGTGFLSIFCAQAGAKKVYAVEQSNIAQLSMKIIKTNGFENVVEVIQSKVEDLELPDNIKVDAIVSEWMGFYLLHKGMLDAVFVARKKFLKEDGKMFPETAAIYVAPCSVPSYHYRWEDRFGFSLHAFGDILRMLRRYKPEVIEVPQENLLGDPVLMGWINVKEDTSSDLETFNIKHVVDANKDGKYQGLCVWFECTFPQLSDSFDKVTLSTSPDSPLTRWKQTVVVLPAEQEVKQGEPIEFEVDMIREKENERRYDIKLTISDPNNVHHPVPCPCNNETCIVVRDAIMKYDRDITNDCENELEQREIDSETDSDSDSDSDSLQD